MRDAVRSKSRTLSILAALFFFVCMLPGLACAQESVAVVLAVQGEAEANQAGSTDSSNMTTLHKGSQIEPFSTVRTGAKSKLVLRWQNGMIASLGESSSISLGSENGKNSVPTVQMISGIARFTVDGDVTDPPSAYTVATPTVSIRPDAVEPSADYRLEIRDPSLTFLTVFSGKVLANDRTNGASEEALYESCRTVNFTKGKKPQVMTADSYDLIRLLDQIMIPGTLPVLDTCPSGLAKGPAPTESTVVVGLKSFRLGD